MRHPFITTAAAVALSLSLVACGGGDEASIVGNWRMLPNAFDQAPPPPVAERQRWEFKEDSTLAARDDGDVVTGTYTLEGELLRMTLTDDGDTVTIAQTAVVTGDRLMFGALTPDGDVDGAVGRWRGSYAVGDSSVELTLDLRADGTGDVTQVEGTSPPSTYPGTWEEQGEALRFSIEPMLGFEFFRVGEEGIGGPLFERI